MFASKSINPATRKDLRPPVYEEYVPATQQIEGNDAVTPKSKVQAWLNDDNGQPSPTPKRRRRQSNLIEVSKFLLDERKNSLESVSAASSSDDYEAELAKICGPRRSDEHVPYRPPSFQNYSCDSAQALIAKYENAATEGAIQDKEDDKPVELNCSKVDENQDAPKAKGDDDLDDTVELEVNENEILKDVRAFVEVRSKNENRSDVVITQLTAMGASIMSKIGPKCTHVIFKEGSLATYNRAKKQAGLFIVSVNWIDACKKNKAKVDESLYPPMNQEKYDSPGLFPRLRKTKSLQPKSDEEFAKIIEAKAQRIMKKKLENSPLIETTPKTSPKVRYNFHSN